ncbi:hypothetical protein [Sporomusa acidovorans]|uniref:DUF4136 domain-containing protein n=1 Tax=Sporomusa acidovorans (strain ATCC 49682 / DSM 3132 / Mol) TaxID=1123286 RepID=A0ABZ3IX00_SPOA4|nr:hypothetical protein [Sporomusa acidovorans]OZC23687.1 hypothetical protein SPACI_05890 [Sporomusa acidovorans DSM 3132]SDE25195.1 hypothetical protein SAMN04488499_1010115 [Sporomusa acidovorans]
MTLCKKIVLLFALLCFSAALPVFAIEPFNVAVLPPVNTAGFNDPASMQIIQSTIKKPFKYPYYSLMPQDAVQNAAKAYLAENKSLHLTNEKSLTAIANKLSADIVVVVELSRAKQTRFSSFRLDDTYVESDVALTCYAYSALTKKYDVLKVKKWETEPESVDTAMSVILKELTEELLVKLPYKRIPQAGLEKPENNV